MAAGAAVEMDTSLEEVDRDSDHEVAEDMAGKDFGEVNDRVVVRQEEAGGNMADLDIAYVADSADGEVDIDVANGEVVEGIARNLGRVVEEVGQANLELV